jgi:hypothetical protein
MVAASLVIAMPVAAQDREDDAQAVVAVWYKLMLELVRHTPTYTPPVAARTFGYVGVTAYESVASGDDNMTSLAGQLNGFEAVPARDASQTYDDAVILQAALSTVVGELFFNTGPTGQRALENITTKYNERVAEGVDPAVADRSRAYGEALAAHIMAWSSTDGGAVIENLGFPESYTLASKPGSWVPTNLIVLQQKPLLPAWGANRPFAMPVGSACPLPAPTEYSEDPNSQFYAEALEVANTVKNLTPEQELIARYWSDDAMLSNTPPGHWIAIAAQIIEADKIDLKHSVDLLARLGIAVADGFIGCWHEKYRHDLLRPLTYINKHIDPKWKALLITPPFPEFPSGHSTQSGAAATVMTAVLGDNYAFEDFSQVPDGFPSRKFTSFWHAADEAGISRLYGGIHFMPAIKLGLDQGRCIGDYAVKLTTFKS